MSSTELVIASYTTILMINTRRSKISPNVLRPSNWSNSITEVVILDNSSALPMGLIPTKRYVELVKERTVDRFLLRLFLREAPLRGLCIVAPFISPLRGRRFSLMDLRMKVEAENIPTYVITRKPVENYQHEAIEVLSGSPWIEVRYNESIHAKVYVAHAKHESESFALFGSGNYTAKSIESNIEIGMLVYSEGPGRELLHELQYWTSVTARTLSGSKLIQPIRAKRR